MFSRKKFSLGKKLFENEFLIIMNPSISSVILVQTLITFPGLYCFFFFFVKKYLISKYKNKN